MNSFSYFSVVIPIYNKERYIANTLNSVLNQTFKDFEIIIINDGSTDKSLEIAKEKLETFKNVIIINQKNQGLSKTRNRGIKVSNGQVIAFLDADDLWCSDFLESLYLMSQQYPEASAFGTEYYEDYSKKSVVIPKKNLPSNLKGKIFIVNDFFTANIFKSIITPSSLAVKSEVAKTLLFDETLSFAEDVDFYIRCFIRYKLVYFYRPKINLLLNVPNQMTQVGFKNKTIPDLDKYEIQYSKHPTLKKYLDFKRYTFAIGYKLNKNKIKFSKLKAKINYANLTTRQKILLKCPRFLLIYIKIVKQIFLKLNVSLTSY